MSNLTTIQKHIEACRLLAGRESGTGLLSYLLGLAEEELRCLLGTYPDAALAAGSVAQAFDALYEIAAAGHADK